MLSFRATKRISVARKANASLPHNVQGFFLVYITGKALSEDSLSNHC